MDVKDAVRKNRSYRRFHEDIKIPSEHLLSMVEMATMTPSGRNIQALKYCIAASDELNGRIFKTLGWAGYLRDWDGPAPGERPSAYIIQMIDNNIATDCMCDDGIQAQSILLRATELGYGGCMIATVNRKELSSILSLPDNLRIRMVIAVGKPKETVVLERMKDGDCKYWRDSSGIHHVPKRPLQEICLFADCGTGFVSK